jgi:hypothetical protein
LGAVKQILGMNICRDRKNKKLTLSQDDYIAKVLQHFSMENAKVVNTPLPNHLKLTKEICPKTQEEEDKMSKLPYASAIGSLVYVMVCIGPDIAHVVGVISMYVHILDSNDSYIWCCNPNSDDFHSLMSFLVDLMST